MIVPVLLTFDLDGEYVWEEIHPGIPYWTTQGEYGPRVGVYRILELLKNEHIEATFCIVGQTAEKYPKAVEAIVHAGHEVAVHGYTHKGYNELTPQTEEEDILKTRKILREYTGKPIYGHRTPRWRPSQNTRKILSKHGFKWNSDHMGTEKPFHWEKTGILEIPVSYILDDWNYYYDWGTPPHDVLDVWKTEFDARVKYDTVFCLTNHPQVTGRPSRITILEKLIAHMKQQKATFMKATEFTDQF